MGGTILCTLARSSRVVLDIWSSSDIAVGINGVSGEEAEYQGVVSTLGTDGT